MFALIACHCLPLSNNYKPTSSATDSVNMIAGAMSLSTGQKRGRKKIVVAGLACAVSENDVPVSFPTNYTVAHKFFISPAPSALRHTFVLWPTFSAVICDRLICMHPAPTVDGCWGRSVIREIYIESLKWSRLLRNKMRALDSI